MQLLNYFTTWSLNAILFQKCQQYKEAAAKGKQHDPSTCSKHIPHQRLVVNHVEYYIHGLKSWSYIVICIVNEFVQELSIVCLDNYLEQENIFKLTLEITLAKLLKKNKGT